jgi:hypothetical protein
VSGYSRQEVAQRAGVDPDYVDRLVELGILTPAANAFSPGDVLRARWLQSLEQAGVPLEGMATAVRDGALSFSFMDVSAFDRFAGLSTTTFQQLSAQTGIPLELLGVVREAVGFAAPRPQDTVREDELLVVSAIQAQLSEGVRPAVIEGWLRVCGDSLRRIAETETAWWHSEVMMLLASGMTELAGAVGVAADEVVTAQAGIVAVVGEQVPGDGADAPMHQSRSAPLKSHRALGTLLPPVTSGVVLVEPGLHWRNRSRRGATCLVTTRRSALAGSRTGMSVGADLRWARVAPAPAIAAGVPGGLPGDYRRSSGCSISGCDASVNSRNWPVTRNATCSPMSTALSPIRSI